MRDEIRELFPSDMKYEDTQPIVNYIEKILQEKELFESRSLELIYGLLDEYDRSLWENIRYIDLADAWLSIIDESLISLRKKAAKEQSEVSYVELCDLRREKLLEYLRSGK